MIIMKKVLYVVLFMLFVASEQVVVADDTSRLTINICQPDYAIIPDSAKQLLESKMQQILTMNGVIDNSKYNRRFVMTSKVNVLSKDIISGMPQKVSQKLEVIFMIGDVLENKVYNSVSLNVVGVDLTEQKSFIKAINTIRPNNPALTEFIVNSKTRIIDFYKENAGIIIEKAEAKVRQGKMREALYDLAQVPDVCWNEYLLCQKKMTVIYKQIIDFDGERFFQQAKVAWSKSPNKSGAKEVTSLLSKIDANASCQPKINDFLAEIESKLVADEKREWEFMLQKYNDRKAQEERDFEFKRKQYEDERAVKAQEYADNKIREERAYQFEIEKHRAEVDLQKQGIAAARDVAIEFAKSLGSESDVAEQRVRNWN